MNRAMARIIQAAHIPNTTPTAIANTYPAGPGLRILASAKAPVIGIAKQRRVRKSHNDTISCTRNFYLPLQPRSQPLRRHRRQLHYPALFPASSIPIRRDRMDRSDYPSPYDAERSAQLERRLRDDQEEYWRAYQILNHIVEQAGPTPLGKKAAERAVFCLRKIHTERFGRSEEIRRADLRLSNWLGRN